jgi:hypothetical protein
MAKRVNYATAITLLGGRSKGLQFLDRLLGGVLLTAAGAGLPLALALFDPKNELSRLANGVVARSLAKLNGLSRFGRSERLAAAQCALVVNGFFTAFTTVELPAPFDEVQLARSEKQRLTLSNTPANRMDDLLEALLNSSIPALQSGKSLEAHLSEVRAFYRTVSGKINRLMQGLEQWERASSEARSQLSAAIGRDLIDAAATAYLDSFIALAADVPEFAYWSNIAAQRAASAEEAGTRHALEFGLMSLHEKFDAVMANTRRSRVAQTLNDFYLHDLTRPILATGDAPSGIDIPSLQDAYIVPDYRAGLVSSSEELATENWWTNVPTATDLDNFFAGHFTNLCAVEHPLLILGQPGSGKSVLTRILAARLPPEDFAVIRVVLREVPAEADIQTHIEYAIRATVGETINWPDFYATLDGALPVILLDGFDELIQATGVNHTDYLERVEDFQEKQASIGQPLAVAVTTRSAVADRARSTPGTIAIRLEPFSEDHVRQWVGMWNDFNRSHATVEGPILLPLEAAISNRELSSQPLLLMMLALYQAESRGSSPLDSQLGAAELYERLLVQFAQREVRKTGRQLTDRDFDKEVERELLRLSITAFSMFNRNRQWTTAAELDEDLSALLGKADGGATASQPAQDMRSHLSLGELEVGRFFFVHQSSATRDGKTLRTIEFLHATFGEYLIGRLLVRELAELAESLVFQHRRIRSQEIDFSFLYALLSYSALTTRGTAVTFLRELSQGWPASVRDGLKQPLLDLFQASGSAPQTNRYPAYKPTGITDPRRVAAYSCNLLLLLLLVSKNIYARELFSSETSQDYRHHWRNLCMLWRGQLPVNAWRALQNILSVERTWTWTGTTHGQRRDLTISYLSGLRDHHPLDLMWSYHQELRYPDRDERTGWSLHNPDEIVNDVEAICDWRVDVISHLAQPFYEVMPGSLVSFQHSPAIGTRSAATLFSTLTLQSLGMGDNNLRELYIEAVWFAGRGAWANHTDRQTFIRLLSRQLARDTGQMTKGDIDQLVDKLQAQAVDDPEVLELLAQIRQ